MKTTTKITAKIKKEIKTANRILLHLHPSPDGDCTGAALAMYFALKQLKKRVTLISGDSTPPQFLSHLPGFKFIKNQNFSQTNLSHFDLFIILDSADFNQISNIKPVTFPSHLKTINIDHHATNPKYADINLVNLDSPATCQILFSLFSQWGINITKNMAACLLTGLYTDTQFKFDYTNWQTFKAAAKLARIYPDFPRLFFQIDNSNSPQTLKLISLFLSSVKTYLNDHVAIASVSQKQFKKHRLDITQTKGLNIPNFLKSVIGWDIDISLYELPSGEIKASFRTRRPQKYDVAKIAKVLGGGGHKAAAGAIINKSLPQAKKIIIDTISAIYPNLGSP